MRLSAAGLVLVACTASAGVSVRSLVFPVESSTSVVELVPIKPLMLTAFTLCMRLSTELKGEREFILFAYRTGDYDELNVWRELDGRFSFYLSGEGVFFSLPDLEALETHLCVTWDSATGAAAMFMDGRKSLTKIYKKGHAIRGGGKVILGQDPDNYVGEFDAKQSYVGEISDVNMWDTVLSQNEIRGSYEGQRVRKGNVLDWETTELNLSGNVHVVNREL